MNQIITANYRRITKKQAAARYKTGQPVYFCPVKLNPESPWGLLWSPSNNSEPWDSVLNMFSFYNCDNERGRYPAFYITRAEWDERHNAPFTPGEV